MRDERRQGSGNLVYWLCAIALAILVLVVAIACVLPNRSGYTLPQYILLWVQNNDTAAFIAEHKGEKSAAEKAKDKGLLFDYGLSIVTHDDNLNIDGDLITYANKELAYVPDYIKKLFVQDGWKVILSETDLGERFEDDGFEPMLLRGLTSYDDDVIYLDANAYSIESAAVHEMGHYLDCRFGFPSSQDEFLSALDADRSMFTFYFSQRSETQDEEMFAEAFSMYCKHQEEMSQYCPHLFDFFANAI